MQSSIWFRLFYWFCMLFYFVNHIVESWLENSNAMVTIIVFSIPSRSQSHTPTLWFFGIVLFYSFWQLPSFSIVLGVPCCHNDIFVNPTPSQIVLFRCFGNCYRNDFFLWFSDNFDSFHYFERNRFDECLSCFFHSFCNSFL